MSDPLTLGTLANLPIVEFQSAATNLGRAATGVAWLRSILRKEGKLPAAGMPRKQRRPRRQRRGRRTRSLGYMRPIRIPVRKCITWNETSGTTGKWLYHLKLGVLCNNFEKVFDEFKVVRLTVTHRPANATSTSGLYAGVLMDQNGFGEFGNATGAAWFKTIASMPGAKVQSPHIGMRFTWRPTEPDSRQWRSYQRDEEKNYVICTIYFADNGDQSTELGGVLIITGTIYVRGKYYDAQVSHALASGPQDDDWDHISEIVAP